MSVWNPEGAMHGLGYRDREHMWGSIVQFSQFGVTPAEELVTTGEPLCLTDLISYSYFLINYAMTCSTVLGIHLLLHPILTH